MTRADASAGRASDRSRPATMADYLTLLWRRKWILVVTPAVAGALAFVLAVRDVPEYRADTLVLLTRTNVVSGVTNTQDPAVFDSTRFLATQANVARSPRLARRVAAAIDAPGVAAGDVLAATRVSPQPDSDMLGFSVRWPTDDGAVRIANAYATEYTRFKAELDTARINSALREIRRRLDTLERGGQEDGAAYQTLAQYQNQLIIGRFLTGNSASVLQPAEFALELRASPSRNLALGGFLGLLLAVGLVFVAEALDRRVRTEDEMEAALRIPLLGRVAPPPVALQRHRRLLMLADPVSPKTEVFRRLRANIDFVNLERGAETIMFTSAVPREGKSTTISNIAVAFARAGRNVALVDLDIRRPSLHTLFGVSSDHGIGRVVFGEDTLEQALRPVVLPGVSSMLLPGRNGQPSPARRRRWSVTSAVADASVAPSHGRHDDGSVLHLLPCGVIPPTGREFLENERVSWILQKLRENFELVLIDAPPLLAVGDAMALSGKVDAMVVITHLGIRRAALHELARQLDTCPAPRLGYIVTGVPQSDEYGYGYGYGYGFETERPEAGAQLPAEPGSQRAAER